MKRKTVCLTVLLMMSILLLCGCEKTNVTGGDAEITTESVKEETSEVLPAEAETERKEAAAKTEAPEPGTDKAAEQADATDGADTEAKEPVQEAKADETITEETVQEAQIPAKTEPTDEAAAVEAAEPVSEEEPKQETMSEAEPEPLQGAETHTVEITVPARYADVRYRIGDVTWNADDSATYRLTEEEHEQLLTEVHDDIQRELDEMCASPYFMDFDSITVNDDCTVFTVICVTIETSMAEQESLSKIYDLGRMYAAYSGEEPANIHLDFMTKIGNTFVMRDSKNDILAKEK